MAAGSIYGNEHTYVVLLQRSRMISTLSIRSNDLKDMEDFRGRRSVKTQKCLMFISYYIKSLVNVWLYLTYYFMRIRLFFPLNHFSNHLLGAYHFSRTVLNDKAGKASQFILLSQHSSLVMAAWSTGMRVLKLNLGLDLKRTVINK